MKHFILYIFLLFSVSLNYCQEPEMYTNPVEQDAAPILFLGTGTGINNFNALLGIFVEGNVVHNFTLAGGFGIGDWGYKAAVAARYYRHYPYKVFYGLGFSSASGIRNIELELYTEPSGEAELVELNLRRANALNLTLGYQFKVFKKSRIYLEFGYGIRLQRTPYEVVTPNVQLDEISIQTLDMMVPGGFIFGVGFSRGFK